MIKMNQGREKENAGVGCGELRGYSFNYLVREASLRRRGENRVMRERTVMGKCIRF